ncbi:hypothetical protein [Pelagibacterium sp.]|uniref:hypothetical protein n=1 Tax=Pelagibacterium sp. TaxID=1967288 RepID=UPI003BA8D05F
MSRAAASSTTLKSYRRGGAMLVKAAIGRLEIDPASVTPILMLEALRNDFVGGKSVWTPNTACVYRQHIRTVFEAAPVEASEKEHADRLRQETLDALKERTGTPVPARGASKKVLVPMREELDDLLGHLRSKVAGHGDIIDFVLALYLLIMPRVGLRPIELTWAERQGNSLIVKTAKRDGRPQRIVPLENWPENYLFALDLLLAAIPRDLSEKQFTKFRNLLASRLARACKWTRTRRRLCLYCCRHIAIANWRDVGMSSHEIAQLAGHVGLAGQLHYARGRSGYGGRYIFYKHPQQDNENLAAAAANVEPKSQLPARAASGFEEADFPVPSATPAETSGSDGEELWRQAREKADKETEEMFGGRPPGSLLPRPKKPNPDEGPDPDDEPSA